LTGFGIIFAEKGSIGNGRSQLESKEQEIMIDLRKWDTATLISCEDEECAGIALRHEVEQNNWNCPYCGKSISKSERHPNSEVSLTR
jgi:hypothetical protein